MQYTLRTLFILLLVGPPTLAELHARVQQKVAEQLLPPLTSGWDIAPQAQSLCLLTVTPRIHILEEEEELLGLDVSIAQE
jgi:hypothetical protein